ncbi:MAG: VOC family protein [Myxococcaceae bacterium]|jgi:catechol 2,3-dioxygenase-like lactoylglutathione lyase family enzyme|nr:VOC family protein [Myxococcaceae bacterium]
MAKVLGIGGVFFVSPNPSRLAAWYRRVLGFEVEPWGGLAFEWQPSKTHLRATVWSPKPDAETFGPAKAPFMINLLVDDLDGLCRSLAKKRVKLDGAREDGEFGKFAWVVDPDGRRVELWEPPRRPRRVRRR